MHKLAPFLVLCSLVTAAVTFPRAQAADHGWNVVVALLVDGELVAQSRYNPDKEPQGKVYASEQACKDAIESDGQLTEDMAEITAHVAAFAQQHPDQEFKVGFGCWAIDDEWHTF